MASRQVYMQFWDLIGVRIGSPSTKKAKAMYKGLFAAILNLALQSQGKPSGMQTFRCGKGRIWRCIPYSKMTTSSSQQAVDFWRLRFEQPSSWAWACVPQRLTAKKEENWGVQGFQQNQSMLLGIFVSQLWVNILIGKVNKDQQPCLSSHSLKILKNFLWLTYDRVFRVFSPNLE